MWWPHRYWSKTLGIWVQLEFLINIDCQLLINGPVTGTMFMSTKMFNENKNIWRQPSESHTLAFGFKVDFSEVRDPIEELGDKPGAHATEFAAMHSDVDDVELPGL
jgi:hypothetical protein